MLHAGRSEAYAGYQPQYADEASAQKRIPLVQGRNILSDPERGLQQMAQWRCSKILKREKTIHIGKKEIIADMYYLLESMIR